MNWKKSLNNFAKQKRAIVGLEAAIILIAFVIIAAVFSFMVVNQGLFATEQGKTVIQQGLQQASTPLSVDGTTFVKTATDGANVTGILIPLKTFGTKYVSMNENTTIVTLKIGSNAWSNVYEGVNASAVGETFNVMLTNVTQDQGKLYIQNSNNDQALDSSEKGFLVISLSPTNAALVRSQVTVEVRLEKTAPLTIEFTIPESMPANAWVNV
jgi:archaeal flagellin FlaB